MHSLIITAHPSSRGFTHRIAATYADACRARGGTTDVIDLYDPAWRQDFLRFEDIRAWPADPVRENIHAKIAAADELVFVFPVWWTDAPAIVKNFLDCNLTTGFAYRYVVGKKTPLKLLTGKTARIFATADGPTWLYRFLPLNFLILWRLGRLGFCGIRLQSADVLGEKRRKNPVDLDAFLARVADRAKSN